MPKNPPEGSPRITPYLFYKDVVKATEWLANTFGFEKRFELPGPDGIVMHAEMALDDGVIMMGLAGNQAYAHTPDDLNGIHQSLYVYVDDIEAHYQQTLANGASIEEEPMEMFWGDRMYTARDLEGHVWTFAQHVKDLAPEDIKFPEI